MKPFHFALIAFAFFLLALVAFFVYQNADSNSSVAKAEVLSEVTVY